MDNNIKNISRAPNKVDNNATVRMDNNATIRINNDSTVRIDADSTVRIDDNGATVRENGKSNQSCVIPNGTVIDGYTIVDTCNVVSGQATVHIAEKDNKQYALKLYFDEQFCISREVARRLQEKIRCPYVIKIEATGEYEGNFYTVTPYYEEGSVIDHLDEVDPKTLKEKYIKQLNEGLNAIHEAGIYHCDIKPNNFYFSRNREKLVIGDFGIAVINDTKEPFIPRRKLPIAGETTAYLANEGRELAGRSVDYYALGMSILFMAHGAFIFEDVDGATIRDAHLTNQIHIPKNVDREVAMLVKKMTELDYVNHRLGYDGVKKWCNDTSCYGKYVENYESQGRVQITNAVLNGLVYNSTEDYVEALQNSWDWALEYYMSDGILNDLARVENVDRQLVKEIADIKYSCKKEEQDEVGFVITQLMLDPNAEFRYRDEKFSNFDGYIEYLCKNYKHLSKCFFDERAIRAQLVNENDTKRIPDDNYKIVLEIVESIFEEAILSRENKMEMLCNYFSDDGAILLNGKKFESISDIAKILFTKKLEPVQNEALFSSAFLNMILTNYNLSEEEKNTFTEIYSFKNPFVRNAQLSIFLTNQIYTECQGAKISEPYDFIELARQLYESSSDCSEFVSYLRNGKIEAYFSQFDSIDNETVNFIKSFKRFKGTDHEALTLFYNNTQQEAIFLFKGDKITNMQMLFDALGKSRSIAKDTEELLKSTEFKMWLTGNGYDEVVKGIK